MLPFRRLFLPLIFVAAMLSSLPVEAAPLKFDFEPESLEKRWSWRGDVALSGEGEIRVALGWKDARNATFLVLKREKNVLSGRLTRFSNGTFSTLTAFPIAAKGEIGLQRVGQRCRVLWNGAVVGEAAVSLAGEQFGIAKRGNVRIESDAPQPTETVVFRDDFMRAQAPGESEAAGEWQVAGLWKTSGTLGPQSDAALSPNPFVFRAQGAGSNVARAGKWWWSDYSVSVAVRAMRNEEKAPLMAAIEAFSAPDGSALRGEIDFARGVARLKNGDKILAQSAPFEVETGQWHRVRLDPGPGVAKLFVDGIMRVSAPSKRAQGGVTLRASAGGENFLDFDDVRVGALQTGALWGEGALPQQFQKDRLMRNWAGEANAWQRDEAGIWWHSGDFFGDATLQMPLPPLESGASWEFFFAADPQNSQTGVRYEIARRGAKNEVVARLHNAASAGKRAVLSGAEMPLRLAFKRKNATSFVLWATLNGQNIGVESLAATPQSGRGTKIGVRPMRNGSPLPPPQGEAITLSAPTFQRENRSVLGVNLTPVSPEIARRIGLSQATGAIVDHVEDASPAQRAGVRAGDVIRGVDGARVSDVEALRAAVGAVQAGTAVRLEILRPQNDAAGLDWARCLVSAPNMMDYSFTSAPVDWRAARGTWEVAERWTCSPQWSFFAGQNDVSPLLWSRFATRGDWTLEAYLATPMDLTRAERSPADLNLSVGGDGVDLASGYSFIFAGRGQSVNQIRRGDAVVWEQPFKTPPGAGEIHQDWFYVRLERRQTSGGVRFRWSVNGRELADYLDPNPLADGGHLGFWTHNGALSIARVRLWHSGLRAPQERAPVAARNSSPELPNALGRWSARGQGREASARLIATAASGQKTALQITNPRSGGDWTTFVTRTPFDPAARPVLQWDYRVSQGVKINLYALIDGSWREIVFNGGPSDGAAPLGAVGGVQSDGAWHRARFDLAGALRDNGLEAQQVQALAFAAPDRDYLRAGLGGNRRGATYWLRDFNAGAF